MLGGWWYQNPETIELEIDSTIKREEIDDALFKIAFFTEINDKAKDEFKEIILAHKNYYNHNNGVTTGHCQGIKQMNYFDAKIVFEYLIRNFNKHQSIPLPILVLINLYSILMGFFLGFIRLFYSESMFGESILEYFIFGGNVLFFYYLTMSTTFFFIAGIKDMKRRKFILNQLG